MALERMTLTVSEVTFIGEVGAYRPCNKGAQCRLYVVLLIVVEECVVPESHEVLGESRMRNFRFP